MAKKSENENRVIYVTRKAFFALIEAFIFDKITGKDLPDDHTLPENYFSVLDDGVTVNVWERAKRISNDERTDEDGVVLDYQSDTISRLHNLGFSYRVLDRRGDSDDYQLSLSEGSEVEE